MSHDALSLDEIQQRFPAPCRQQGTPPAPGTYCVGMAFLLAHHLWDSEEFPGEYDIASALADMQPLLDVHRHDYTGNEHEMTLEDTLAYACAEAITTHNDAGDFAAAWDTLRRALSVGEVSHRGTGRQTL